MQPWSPPTGRNATSGRRAPAPSLPATRHAWSRRDTRRRQRSTPPRRPCGSPEHRPERSHARAARRSPVRRPGEARGRAPSGLYQEMDPGHLWRLDVQRRQAPAGLRRLSHAARVRDRKAVMPPAEAVPDTGLTLRQYYVMVGLGAFVTTIAQPGVIGRLPLQLLLKQELHFTAQTLAAFMLIATFAWNVKPVAGILSDAFPLFGTRRRHYMLLGSGLAALCWFLTGVVPRSYWPLLLATFGANTFMVIASTVMGGLMVEAGQKYGISGRITSLRQALQSIVSVGKRRARRLPRRDGVRLDGRHRDGPPRRAGRRDAVHAHRASHPVAPSRGAARRRPADGHTPSLLAALGRRHLPGARLHLTRLSDTAALSSNRHAEVQPAIHRAHGNDRGPDGPRRRTGLRRALPPLQPAPAPRHRHRGERRVHARVSGVLRALGAGHPRARRPRRDLLGARVDAPCGPRDAARLREPRVRDHDERAELRDEGLGRDRLVAPRQPRLGVRRSRVAQRGHHGARSRVHAALAATPLAGSGRRAHRGRGGRRRRAAGAGARMSVV